ncbi:RraA family protein [Lentibacillus salinarum]|uniref:Putative 4-hydroxy-4-methyl-2-oxoglutarate aldolase n=1 Tax=Lentibacillus salinarum TaxID=446820 RepID=A0ABW3ZU23_9BACI
MTEFYPTTGISDAMNKMNTMDVEIKAIASNVNLMGPAYTVKCYPGGIITCHKALAEVPSGYVLVVEGNGNCNEALWGELTSMEAMQRGVKGIVVDGAVRDVADIRELGFPTFSRYISPRVGSNKTLGTTGSPIVCGGVTVNQGDLIVGDDNGVAVVPKGQIEEILDKAVAIEKKEAAIAEKVKNGAHIADLIGLSSIINEAEKQ